MANLFGTEAAKRQAAIKSMIEQGQLGGRVKVHYDEFALSADIALNDVIYMGGKLPAGARVMEVVIDSPDLDSGALGALTSGWLASDDAVEAADADGFLTTVDVHTSGKTLSMSSLLCSVVPGKFKKFASEVQPAITVSGETNATSGTIKQAIYYIVD